MVTADAVVVATNTPVNDLIAIHTKQAAYQTYVIGARVPVVQSRARSTGTRRIHITTFALRLWEKVQMLTTS